MKGIDINKLKESVEIIMSLFYTYRFLNVKKDETNYGISFYLLLIRTIKFYFDFKDGFQINCKSESLKECLSLLYNIQHDCYELLDTYSSFNSELIYYKHPINELFNKRENFSLADKLIYQYFQDITGVKSKYKEKFRNEDTIDGSSQGKKQSNIIEDKDKISMEDFFKIEFDDYFIKKYRIRETLFEKAVNFRLIYLYLFIKNLFNRISYTIDILEKNDLESKDFPHSFYIQKTDLLNFKLLKTIYDEVDAYFFEPETPILFMSLLNLYTTKSNSPQIIHGMRLPVLYLLHILYNRIKKDARKYWLDIILDLLNLNPPMYKSYSKKTIEDRLRHTHDYYIIKNLNKAIEKYDSLD